MVLDRLEEREDQRKNATLSLEEKFSMSVVTNCLSTPPVISLQDIPLSFKLYKRAAKYLALFFAFHRMIYCSMLTSMCPCCNL